MESTTKVTSKINSQIENKTKKLKRSKRNAEESGEEEDNDKDDNDDDDDSYKSLTIAEMAAQGCENQIFVGECRYLSVRHPFSANK